MIVTHRNYEGSIDVCSEERESDAERRESIEIQIWEIIHQERVCTELSVEFFWTTPTVLIPVYSALSQYTGLIVRFMIAPCVSRNDGSDWQRSAAV